MALELFEKKCSYIIAGRNFLPFLYLFFAVILCVPTTCSLTQGTPGFINPCLLSVNSYKTHIIIAMYNINDVIISISYPIWNIDDVRFCDGRKLDD